MGVGEDNLSIRDKSEIQSALEAYSIAVENEAVSEKDVDLLFERVEDLVPHARFIDLYFYSERDRSPDQIIAEAITREAVWEREGLWGC